MEKEFGVSIGYRVFVTNVRWEDQRGSAMSTVWLCELDRIDHLVLKGKWFAVDNLPDQMVLSHKLVIIPAAIGAFVVDSIIRPKLK